MKRKAEEIPKNLQEEKKRNTNLADSILKSNTKILREDFSVPKYVFIFFTKLINIRNAT